MNEILYLNVLGVIVSQTAYPDSNDWRHSSVGIQIDRIGALETQNSQKVLVASLSIVFTFSLTWTYVMWLPIAFACLFLLFICIILSFQVAVVSLCHIILYVLI